MRSPTTLCLQAVLRMMLAWQDMQCASSLRSLHLIMLSLTSLRQMGLLLRSHLCTRLFNCPVQLCHIVLQC